MEYKSMGLTSVWMWEMKCCMMGALDCLSLGSRYRDSLGVKEKEHELA